MKSTYKVLKHEVYFGTLVKITLENEESLMTTASDIEDVISGEYEFELSNNDNTYLMTLDNCKAKIFSTEKLLFIKLS